MGKLGKIFVAIATALNLHQVLAFTKEQIIDPGQAKDHGTFNPRLANTASTVAYLEDTVIGVERKVIFRPGTPLTERRDDKPPP